MNKLNCLLIGLFLIVGWSLQGHGQTNDTLVKKDMVYDIVESLPEFPGGERAYMKFLADNLKYPEELRNIAIKSTVLLSFIVEIDGSITNIQVVRSAHKLLDEEAERVVKLMPKWKPAMKNGKPVRVRHRLPIHIDLK